MRPGARAIACLALVLFSCDRERDVRPAELTGTQRRKLFVMFSPVATREMPHLVRRYAQPRDYVRMEAFPLVAGVQVPRARRYVLPATLRRSWAGEPGVRHWVAAGCSPEGPGTIVYDPEHWHLTPAAEQRNFTGSVQRAAALVHSTGCHRFGLAPDATFMFGMNPERCSYELDEGLFDRAPWKKIALVDIQAQLLLSDQCVSHLGVAAYAEVVSSIAEHVRLGNPETLIAAQVSFRHTPPARMKEAISRVADVIDGIYFSYPAISPEAACRYCSAPHLRSLLRFLRGPLERAPK